MVSTASSQLILRERAWQVLSALQMLLFSSRLRLEFSSFSFKTKPISLPHFSLFVIRQNVPDFSKLHSIDDGDVTYLNEQFLNIVL